MPSKQESRRRRSRSHEDATARLIGIVRRLAGIAAGQGSGKKRGRRRHSSRKVEPESRAVEQAAPIGREKLSGRGLSVAAFGGLAFLYLGWNIVADTRAFRLALSEPELAIEWNASESLALELLAERNLASPEGRLDDARVWAERALVANPLDSRAISVLGQIAEKKGDHERADRMMRLAGERTWRDNSTQSWLFDRHVRRGEFSDALPHIDAVLRTNLDLQSQLLPVLASFTVKPPAFKALTDFLETAPPWRTWFLSELSARLADRARLVELFNALKVSAQPPTKDELQAYINRLVNDGSFDIAYETWRETLPASMRGNISVPYNKDFEAAVDRMPFNWVVTQVAGADIQVVPSPDGGTARVLRVEFSGARVNFANVRQVVLLPPGDYIFLGKVKTERLAGPRGLWWNILCAGKPPQSLAHTELAIGTAPWTDFSINFTVPATGCTGQVLQLELPARIPSEHLLEGQVWYQQLRILSSRDGTKAPKTN